jgi:RimJ/RimL family protein N-acetyltransferase
MITEGRVRLRALEEDDLERTRIWVNDPEVACLVNRVAPVTAPEHREWFQRVAGDPHQVIFAIEIVADATHIGNCGLKGIDARSRKAELWMYLGSRDVWGKGYGTDACRALCRYGFERLNLRRIHLYTPAYNRRAVALYEKIGFKTEGVLRQEVFQGGQYHDAVVMGLLRQEFCGPESVS